MRTHEGPHDGTHSGCFGCRIKGVAFAPSAMPSRRNKVPPRKSEPGWEKGTAGEHRADGSFMPWLKPGTELPMGVKEASERRHQLDATRRRNHGST